MHLPGHQRIGDDGGLRISWLAKIVRSLRRWITRQSSTKFPSLQPEGHGALSAEGNIIGSAQRHTVATATHDGHAKPSIAGLDAYIGRVAIERRQTVSVDEPQQISGPDEASEVTEHPANHSAAASVASQIRTAARNSTSELPTILEPAAQEASTRLAPPKDNGPPDALPDDLKQVSATTTDSIDLIFARSIIEPSALDVKEEAQPGIEDEQTDPRPALPDSAPESSEQTPDLPVAPGSFAVGQDPAAESGVCVVDRDSAAIGHGADGHSVSRTPEQAANESEDTVGPLETVGPRTPEEDEGVSIGSAHPADEAETKPAQERITEPGVTSRTGTPSKYRPRLREQTRSANAVDTSRSTGQQTAGSLEAILMISFQPGGWGIATSVLLTRADGMPEEIDTDIGGERHSLLAIDDRLYEPVQLSDATTLLSNGIAATSAAPPVRRWVRTARDLHVFSERTGVSGFASVPRALIGQENVVFCKSELANTVVWCLETTGSAAPVEVTGPGIPDGWRCYRGVRPLHPAVFGGLDDKFLALNPLPNAAIELSGGISLARSAWVQGQPPIIRILGAEPAPGELTIDGASASRSDHDGWIASGWDALGRHTIRFAGLSRTYEVVEIVEAWPTWRTSDASPYSACGAKVSSATQTPSFAVSGEACWLVGASPGDIAFAAQTSAGLAIATPTFRPVWALSPGRGGRPSFVRGMPHQTPPQRPPAQATHEQILHWCQLVRSAAAPRDTRERDLWLEYRRVARGLRRRRR